MSAATYPTVKVWQTPYVSSDWPEHPDRQWRWHFAATNGKIVADSAEGYHRRIRALQGAQIALGLKGIENMHPGDTKLVRRSGGPVLVKVESDV